jgi:hypothetical protein
MKLLRFADLKAANLVGNWVTLRHWMREEDFPAGRLVGPNTRAWTEAEIEAWLATRPSSRRASNNTGTTRGA